MKYLFFLILFLNSFNLFADDSEPPTLKALAFAVKGAMIPDNYKDVKYEDGEKFALNNRVMAYRLYYSTKFRGKNGVLQINCKYKYDGKTWEQDYCKAVKFG